MSELAVGKRTGKIRLLGALTGAGLVVAGVSGYVLVTRVTEVHSRPTATPRVAHREAPLVSAAGLAERSGVRLTQLALTGAGGLVDLRYQVIDPEKANALHERKSPPVLVDERNGLVVNELLMGHMHHGHLKAGQSYYLIFLNPGNLVHSGARMTVRLGEVRVAHIPVQ